LGQAPWLKRGLVAVDWVAGSEAEDLVVGEAEGFMDSVETASAAET
jgi:hypothetical protein